MMREQILFFILLAAAVFITVRTNKLTPVAGLAGALVATCIYFGAGIGGIAMLGAFFLLGTIATSVGSKTKQALTTTEPHTGRRTASQVLANGGVAAICAALAVLSPAHKEFLTILLAASLSSATADTLSSELGTVYGKRFYNILSFRKDTRGENGVISLEGTLLGIAGSALMAGIHALAFGYSVKAFLIVLIAGTLGNITDSLLGATLERTGRIKNDTVNFLNTTAAALVALVMSCYK